MNIGGIGTTNYLTARYLTKNEESALKRKLQEQEADKVYYHNSKIKGQVFVSYEQNSIQMATVQK